MLKKCCVGGVGEQVIKPNKFTACESIHQMYYECSIVTEASFGKFINRCAGLKEKLDECNVREQVCFPTPASKQAAPPNAPAFAACNKPDVYRCQLTRALQQGLSRCAYLHAVGAW